MFWFRVVVDEELEGGIKRIKRLNLLNVEKEGLGLVWILWFFLYLVWIFLED